MSRIVYDMPGKGRFELGVDGELVGWSEYRPAGGSVIHAHTEIDERRVAQDWAACWSGARLIHIRASGMTVVPTRPFTAAYIGRQSRSARRRQLRRQFALSI